MTSLGWLAVVAAGAVGAPLRYLSDTAIGHRNRGVFPWGTLAVNTAGSLLAGFLSGLAIHHGLSDPTRTVLAVGFCGALTTFSTFTYETVHLIEQGAIPEAIRNTAVTLALGVAAAATGIGLAGLV